MQNPNGKGPSRNPLTGGPQGEKKNGKGEPQPRRPRIPPWIVGLLLVGIIGWYVYQYFGPATDNNRVSVPYSTFLAQIDAKNIKEAVVSDTRVDSDLNAAIRWDSSNEAI